MNTITKPRAAQIAPSNPFRELTKDHLAHRHRLIPVEPGGKKPAFFDGAAWKPYPVWQKAGELTAQRLDNFKKPKASNMGFVLGPHPALAANEVVGVFDMDVTDPKLKAALEPVVQRWGLSGFWRFGHPEKMGAVFVIVELPDASASLGKSVLDFGGGQKVEFLCDGQQVLIDGLHPAGSFYGWADPAKALPAAPVTALPRITLSQRGEVMAALAEAGTAAGLFNAAAPAAGAVTVATGHAVLPVLSDADARLLQAGLAEAADKNDIPREQWVQGVKTYAACCEAALGTEQVVEDLIDFTAKFVFENGNAPTAVRSVLDEHNLPDGFGLRHLCEVLAERVSPAMAEALRAMALRAEAQEAFGAASLDQELIEAIAACAVTAATTGWVRDMNQRYAFVAGEGTSSALCLLRFRTDGSWHLDNINTAMKFHANDLVEVGERADGTPITKNRLDAWLKHPQRRSYGEGIRFMFRQPGEAGGFFNSWRGWGVEPVAGSCDLTIAHIRDVLCNGDAEAAEYTLNFLAAVVQRLGPMGAVIVFRGKPGTGKGWLSKMLRTMLGGAATTTAKGDYVTGKFNLHLRDLRLLICEEAFFSADPSIRGLLKALITEDRFSGEGKGLPPVEVENNLAMLWFTNENWAAPAEANDRRYCVIETGDARDAAYYDMLWSQGLAEAPAFLHYLLNRDISKFRVQDFPKTAARDDQIVQGLTGLDQFLFQMLARGGWPKGVARDVPEFDVFKDWEAQPIEVPKDSLRGALEAFSRRDRHGRYVADKLVKDRLEAMGCTTFRPTVDGKRGARVWIFPALENARQNFAMVLGLSGQGVWADDGVVVEAAAAADEDEI